MPDINLDNSDKRLVKGLTRLLRNEVDGWSTSPEYSVPNVWPKSPPDEVDDEYPRGVVDIISSEDSELSIDLDVKLREATIRVLVFSDSSNDTFDLTDDSEDVISSLWDSEDPNGEIYIGDWTFREFDGSAETSETGETEGQLRYSRYKDFVFETVKTN